MSFLLCLARPIPTDGPEGTQRVSEHPWPVAGKSGRPVSTKARNVVSTKAALHDRGCGGITETQGGNEMGMHPLGVFVK